MRFRTGHLKEERETRSLDRFPFFFSRSSSYLLKDGHYSAAIFFNNLLSFGGRPFFITSWADLKNEILCLYLAFLSLLKGFHSCGQVLILKPKNVPSVVFPKLYFSFLTSRKHNGKKKAHHERETKKLFDEPFSRFLHWTVIKNSRDALPFFIVVPEREARKKGRSKRQDKRSFPTVSFNEGS